MYVRSEAFSVFACEFLVIPCCACRSFVCGERERGRVDDASVTVFIRCIVPFASFFSPQSVALSHSLWIICLEDFQHFIRTIRKNKFPIFRLHANTFLAFGYNIHTAQVYKSREPNERTTEKRINTSNSRIKRKYKLQANNKARMREWASEKAQGENT